MDDKNFKISFLVDQKPKDVFNSINNVRGWWSEEIKGKTDKLHDEFSYRNGDVHYSKHKLIEIVVNKRIVWLITDSELSFVKTKNEWNGTKMIFEISKQKDKTKLNITHLGLVPEFECYKGCSKGWTHYLRDSLLPLIINGQGMPDKKSNG